MAATTGTCAAGAPGVTASLLDPRSPSLLPDPDPLLLQYRRRQEGLGSCSDIVGGLPVW
jgi:hypothetical protein